MNPISFGVSSTLQADFDLLRETPNLLGDAKYTQKTIDKLAQYIVCRNYGKLCLELCYLCWPIVKYGRQGQALLDFFWLQEVISPKGFRASIEGMIEQHFSTLSSEERLSAKPSIKLDEVGLKITPQQQSFTVSATRIAVLSAFLEWLSSYFSGFIEELELNLNTDSEAQVKKVASLLQQRIYALLKEHLPSANVQQKFRFIHEWKRSNSADVRFNDKQVLQFWQAAFQQEGYVKYQSALLDVLDYDLACELNQNKLKVERANNIDEAFFDFQGGELEPQMGASLFELYTDCIDGIADMSRLTQQPKLISKQQYQDVALLLEQQESIHRLSLSLLRATVFSPWQAKIIQRSRQKDIHSTNSNVTDLRQPALDYDAYALVLDKWIKNACAAMLSCVGILYEKKDARCLGALLITLSHMLDEQSKRTLDNVVRSAKIRDLTFSGVSAALLQNPLLNKHMQLAMQHLKANNRDGFRKGSEYADADIYSSAINNLHQCMSTIGKFKKATASVRNEENYRSDLFIFFSEFEKRHGGING
ncbi:MULTISPECIES: hypothetical protein [Alteromonadaceae]|uniref:Uncharacterized protein n=1 Tax=Brumicola blandensis TaxID=3075611 RepID=A0AAW8QZA3_9ALTE|nr:MULTISPECIES: hypothetical protein [unclassified Alteromonas]MDT0581200.1 hypothetical protein [Alteromonas sp. W409]MDT0626817.1 hypothetical protein [Alteromonas sp. W364]